MLLYSQLDALDTRISRAAERLSLTEQDREALLNELREWRTWVNSSLPAAGDMGARQRLHSSQVRGRDQPTPGLRELGPSVLATDPWSRYQDLGTIASGGMGEIRRILDRSLNRVMVMKVLRPEHLGDPDVMARFIEEAQATAQLQHPGIVPMHEVGRLADGRPYFTMKEIRGRTFKAVIDAVHEASPGADWRPVASSAGGFTGWTFRRLIWAFLTVCETVAYAHARGVIHRDLKPANIMVGDFSEVLVIDWGIALITGRAEQRSTKQPVDPVITSRSRNRKAGRPGYLSGTPEYMPPEQARGEMDNLTAAADVYSLGATLYEILSNRPPFSGETPLQVLERVTHEEPLPPGRFLKAVLAAETVVIPDRLPLQRRSHYEAEVVPIKGPPLPSELVRICRRSMDRKSDERYRDAGELAVEVRAWLDGDDWKTGSTYEITFEPDDDTDAEEALDFRERAAVTLAGLSGPHPAQNPGDLDRPFLKGTPPEFRMASTSTLEGLGRLHLITDPPGAEVGLFRFELFNKRMSARFVRALGRTPIQGVTLAPGSYLLKIQAQDRAEVSYPVQIAPDGLWDGVGPNASTPTPIFLPKREDLGPNDCYVPAGWFWSGGDAQATASLPSRRLWVDGFVVRRFPVTHREYLAFLNDLVRQNREEEALRWVPQEGILELEVTIEALYARSPDGSFSLKAEHEGENWRLNQAAVMVDWPSTMAYSAWEAQRTGQLWRLPWELEWEKAARGVDGRVFPWGTAHLDPTWAATMRSPGTPKGAPDVESYPIDESPYGVRDMAGNVRDYCLDVYQKEGPPVKDGRFLPLVDSESEAGSPCSCRGGTWATADNFARCAERARTLPLTRAINLGFRLARGLSRA